MALYHIFFYPVDIRLVLLLYHLQKQCNSPLTGTLPGVFQRLRMNRLHSLNAIFQDVVGFKTVLTASLQLKIGQSFPSRTNVEDSPRTSMIDYIRV